jgi:hypothetical protein
VATLTTWLNKIKNKPLVKGECNCTNCRTPKDPRALVQDALEDLFKNRHIPRQFDPAENFNGRDGDFRRYQEGSVEQWRAILRRIHLAHTTNESYGFNTRRHRICDDCGSMYIKGKGRIVKEDVHVCPDCWKRHYMKCKICGEVKDSRNSRRYQKDFDYKTWISHGAPDSDRICSSCFARHFMACNSCGMPLNKEHWVNISLLMGHVRAERDYHILPMGREPRIRLRGDEDVQLEMTKRPYMVLCKHCVEEEIIPCPRCGEDAYKRNMSNAEWGGNVQRLCQTCVEAMIVVKRYNYVPVPKFLTAKAEPIRREALNYGVEIEMERAESDRDLNSIGRDILDWWGSDDMYIKHDGSLEHGFELVSHPFTWSHYLNNKNKWTDYLLYIRDLGMSASYYSTRRSIQTCGFHTHMSQAAFTPVHLYKFVQFFYKKSARALITGIAERDHSDFAKFEGIDLSQAAQMCKDKQNPSGSRYSAINMMGGHAHEQGNAPGDCKTVEVRIFKGDLEPYIFHKNLEFLQSVFEFSSMNPPKGMLVKKYIEHLLLKPDNWRCLLSFIKGCPKINTTYAYVRGMLKGV